VIASEQRSFNTWSLTDEGKQVLQHGSHEAVVYNAVDPNEGTLQAEVMVSAIVSVQMMWIVGCHFVLTSMLKGATFSTMA